MDPLVHETPLVAICLGCNTSFWLSKAKNLGVIDWLEDGAGAVDWDPCWRDADQLEEPVAEEYHRAIAMGMATNPGEERMLRILTWWRENDAFRNWGPTFSDHKPTGQSRNNLEALCKLLGEEHVGERLMRVEALRHLGEFHQARSLLEKTSHHPFEPVVEQLRCLLDAKDCLVRELYLVGD